MFDYGVIWNAVIEIMTARSSRSSGGNQRLDGLSETFEA
jgi:hypothetical protein